MQNRGLLQRLLLGTFVILMSCSPSKTIPTTEQDGPPPFPVDLTTIKEPAPKSEPLSAYGNPEAYTVNGKTYHVTPTEHYKEQGLASWYGTKFQEKRTSSGEPYDMLEMTAAHKTLPIPCYVKVTNLENDRQVIVKVNDRGPFHEGRIIDLSYAAAAKLGITKVGTGHVEVSLITPPSQNQELASGSNQKTLYLQVGAFTQKANAERLAKKLEIELLQYPVYLKNTTQGDQQYYLVQIGPMETPNQHVYDTLKLEGLTPTTIMR